jgi:hypothetical protein
MARGWGRSEEDLAADKEQASGDRSSPRGRRRDAARLEQMRALELSLARIEEQLRATASPARRKALEAAKAEVARRLRESSAAK